MRSETWRPIPGLEGRYDVSDFGRIRSWIPNGSAPRPLIMAATTKGTRGHLMVRPVFADGSRPSMLVHRAVLATFVGPCPEGMEVRHLDGDPTNNHLSNLRYGTHSENELDKVLHGVHRNASKTHCPAGHEYAPENTYWSPSRTNRTCRTCRRLAATDRGRRARARAQLRKSGEVA